MVHEGTHNPNLTLKGYAKKFWGLFGRTAHKTQQIKRSQPPKGGLSLTLMMLKHSRAHIFHGFWSHARTLREASNITSLIIFSKVSFSSTRLWVR